VPCPCLKSVIPLHCLLGARGASVFLSPGRDAGFFDVGTNVGPRKLGPRLEITLETGSCAVSTNPGSDTAPKKT